MTGVRHCRTGDIYRRVSRDLRYVLNLKAVVHSSLVGNSHPLCEFAVGDLLAPHLSSFF